MDPSAPPPRPLPGVDAAFLRRVYWISLGIALLGGAFLGVYHSAGWGAGFAVAGTWSVINLWALGRVLKLATRQDPEPASRRRLTIALALLLKVPVLYGLAALIVLKGSFPPFALVAGFSVPLAVVVLKVAGQILAPRVALPDRGSPLGGHLDGPSVRTSAGPSVGSPAGSSGRRANERVGGKDAGGLRT